VKSHRLSSRAKRELAGIIARIELESGSQRAERFRAELLRNLANLVLFPHAGHEREDLTSKAVLFWTVDSYLIVYRPDSDPLRVLSIVHGAGDPEDLRDYVGEPVATYVVSGASVIEVSLNENESMYLDARLRLGNARSAADLMLSALRSMIDPVAEERRAYEAWREEVRRGIEIGHQECLAGDTVDGEEAMERIRLELEALRARGS